MNKTTKTAPKSTKARPTSVARKPAKRSKEMNNEPMVKRATKKAVAAAIAEAKGPSTADLHDAKKAPKARKAKTPAPQIENDNKLTPAQMPDPVPSMTDNAPKAPKVAGVRNYARGPKQHHSEIEGPCAYVHDLFFDALRAAGGDANAIKRADVIKQAVEDGVDIHTAKTQFQKARGWAAKGLTARPPKKVRTKKADAKNEGGEEE